MSSFFLTATIPLPAHRTHPKPPPIPPRHHRAPFVPSMEPRSPYPPSPTNPAPVNGGRRSRSRCVSLSPPMHRLIPLIPLSPTHHAHPFPIHIALSSRCSLLIRHISSEQPEEDHFISEAEDEGSVIGRLELKHTVSWHLTVQTSSSFPFTIFPSLYFPSRAR